MKIKTNILSFSLMIIFCIFVKKGKINLNIRINIYLPFVDPLFKRTLTKQKKNNFFITLLYFYYHFCNYIF